MKYGPKRKTAKPIELLSTYRVKGINGVKQLRLNYLKKRQSIYFLCKGDEVMYIGHTTNLKMRIYQHVNFYGDSIDKILYFEKGASRDKELSLIHYYRPPWNGCNKEANSDDIKLVHQFLNNQ